LNCFSKFFCEFQGDTAPALKKVEVSDFIENKMRAGRASNENDDREYTQGKKHPALGDGFSSLDDFCVVNDLLPGPGKALGSHYPASGNDEITGRGDKAGEKNHGGNLSEVQPAGCFEFAEICEEAREPETQAKGNDGDADEVGRKKPFPVLFIRFKDFRFHGLMHSFSMDVLIIP